jgi:hypothetical protein
MNPLNLLNPITEGFFELIEFLCAFAPPPAPDQQGGRAGLREEKKQCRELN